MRKKPERRSNCPVSCALDTFGDKWTLLIVRDLMFNQKSSYGEFLKSGEGMATNILADRLEMLERIGIVEKTKNTENKTKFIYSLTPKGIDLLPIIIEFIVWSAKHDLGTDVSEEFIAQAKKNRKRLIVKIGTVLKQKRVYPI